MTPQTSVTFVRVYDAQAGDPRPQELSPDELPVLSLMASREISSQRVEALDEQSFGPHTRLMNTVLKRGLRDAVIDVSGWPGFDEIDRMQLDLSVVRAFNVIIMSCVVATGEGSRTVIRRPEDVMS